MTRHFEIDLTRLSDDDRPALLVKIWKDHRLDGQRHGEAVSIRTDLSKEALKKRLGSFEGLAIVQVTASHE